MLSIKNNEFKLGQNALTVCQTIIRNNPSIISIRLIAHKVEVNWRQKYINNEEKINALNIAFEHPIPIKERILSRGEFEVLTFNDLNDLAPNEVWSITSKVSCDDGVSRHIPMMNFHPPEDISLNKIKLVISKVNKNHCGVILNSGRYYHYYAPNLLSEDEWHKFLANFLMPCVIVSPRYIGHRLYDGYCALRLTPDTTFKPVVPRVIDLF